MFRSFLIRTSRLKHVRQIFIIRTLRSSSGTAKDHYSTLGLKKDCSQKEIRDKYVELSKIHHPDMNQGNQDRNPDHNRIKFQEINEAYQQLSKVKSRQEYDMRMRSGINDHYQW